VVVLHPELVPQNPEQPPQDMLFRNDNMCFDSYMFMNDRRWSSGVEDKFLGLLITMGSFVLTIMLVYGAVKGRPGYLMPFFCLQVFDFCISCLTVVGYFSYIPDLKNCLQLQENMPYREELMSMDADWLMLMAIIFFVFVLTVKAYLIGVVWACYKYLTQYERTVTRGVIRTYDTETGNTDDTEMLLPPKYEDAVRMSAEEPAPPPYAE